jgi:hypothetical protein
MTQIPITTQPGDVVVIVPLWLMRAVGFFSLFIALGASFVLFLMGFTSEGLLFSVAMLVLVPLVMFIQYILWRFYWYLILVGLLVQLICFGLALAGVASQAPFSDFDSPIGTALSLVSSINPLSALLALFLSALITFILYRVYALWQRPRLKATSSGGDDVTSDFGPPLTLMERVVKKLEATGSQAKVEGATVQVYKGGQFMGIVRVIDRPVAITATNVNDVVKLRDRLGVKIAYIATTGHFESDIRALANTQGVRIMVI